jgi:hypothetical protein
MSSSHSSSKPPRSSRRKSKRSSRKSLTILNRSGNSLAQQQSQLFVQMVNMVKANINVSASGLTYNNASSSSTFCSGSNTVTTDPCFATYFTLSDLPQEGTFAALYDQYRIREIEVTFSPSVSTNQAPSALVALTVPEFCMYYAIDFDDAAVVSPLSALFEYEGCKRHDFLHGGPLVVRFKPRIAVGAYNGTFVGFANQSDQWIDCATPTVQHYGIKWGIPALINNTYSNGNIALTVRYVIEFKTVR